MYKLDGKFENSYKYVHGGYLYYFKKKDSSSGRNELTYRCVDYKDGCQGEVLEIENETIEILKVHDRLCEKYDHYIEEENCRTEILKRAREEKNKKFKTIVDETNKKLVFIYYNLTIISSKIPAVRRTKFKMIKNLTIPNLFCSAITF